MDLSRDPLTNFFILVIGSFDNCIGHVTFDNLGI
jgi:hypothetical protein